MRVLSLFSGAGGADLALEAAGFEIAALCEIEPHARAVLREHWPNVPLHGDIDALVGGRRMRRRFRDQYAGKVDVVVGGSPCQDLSVAGKRAGLKKGSGTRSSLFFRQVSAWRISRAPYLIWENVPGALSSQKGADFAAVLSALVGSPVAVPADGWASGGVAAGREAVAAWRLLDLQQFGVPQRRERIVVLAARAGGVDPAEVLALGESVRWDSPPRFEAREGVAADSAPGVGGKGGAVAFAQNQLGEVRVGDTMGTLNTNSNASGRATPMALQFAPPVAHTLSAEGCDAREDGTGRGTPLAVQAYGINNDSRAEVIAELSAPLRSGQRQQPAVLTYDARGNGDGTIVNTMAGDHQNRVTDYTALVVDKQGAGVSEHIAPTLKTDLAHQMGPVVLGEAPPKPKDLVLASGQANAEVTEGISPTLTNLHEAPITFAPGIPRRLMPIECERLMGWPDDWTKFGVDERGRRYELKDTPRYKLCGNGIGREWMEWTGLRLRAAVDALNGAVA